MACNDTETLSLIDVNRDHRLQESEFQRAALDVMNLEAMRVRAGEVSREYFAQNYGNLSESTFKNNYTALQNSAAVYFSGGFENLRDQAITEIRDAGRNLTGVLASEKLTVGDGIAASVTLALRRSKAALQCF